MSQADIIIFVLYPVAIIWIVRLMEQRIDAVSSNLRRDLLRVVNRVYGEKGESGSLSGFAQATTATGFDDALEIADLKARRISRQIPPLRRVLKFSMMVPLDHLDKAGIKSEAWAGLTTLHVAARVEEWATHTVIFAAEHPTTLYAHESLDSFDPIVVWQQELTKTSEDRTVARPELQLVLHGKHFKLWAVHGRFGTIPPSMEACPENVFATIPLDEAGLAPLRLLSTERADPDWVRRYRFNAAESPISWGLTVVDLVRYTVPASSSAL